jgi:hypothetical protein
MTLTLDPTTEKRIQREIDLGHYTAPEEVIAHALALLTGEAQAPAHTSAEGKETAIDEVFGIWANRNIDGVAYQQRMRDEW